MTVLQLIAEIDSFAARQGVAGATVTSRAVGNSRLYGRLLSGRSCTLDVADRLRRYIAAHSALPDPASDHPDPLAAAATPTPPVTPCPENEVSRDA